MSEDETQTPAPQRKPYRRPKLTVYGDIRELTHNVQRNSVRDGGSNSART
ncbi:MAG TPA: hypothetical protein VF824_20150 [Thermoanaerobaculia bacterium]|jgi:hypothetical protein